MTETKPVSGTYDDAQLRVMDAVLDRVLKAIREAGVYSEASNDFYRSYVASVVIEAARTADYEEDELTRRVLNGLIKPHSANDAGPAGVNRLPGTSQEEDSGALRMDLSRD